MKHTQKKILYYYNYTSIHTGSPRSMIDLVEALDEKFYKSVIMTPYAGGVSQRANELNIETCFGKSASLSRQNIPAFIKSFFEQLIFLKKNKIDLIHLNSPGWRESSILAAMFLNIPVVLHIRNHFSSKEVKGNFNYKIAKKIVVISNSMKSIFKEFPQISKKIECIYNGIDVQKFSPEESKLKCKFQNKSKLFIIGFVGQICHHKGLDLLIKAASSLIKEFPQVRFLVVGPDGVNEEGLGQKYLQELEQADLSDYFDFLGKRDDIPEIMNFVDILVLPSRKEAFGKVIVEAMACRKCVIASDAGGIPEIIEDGKTGFLFPSENVEKLTQCIRKVITNDDLREKVAKNALTAARTKFSTDLLIQNIQNLYSSLI